MNLYYMMTPLTHIPPTLRRDKRFGSTERGGYV